MAVIAGCCNLGQAVGHALDKIRVGGAARLSTTSGAADLQLVSIGVRRRVAAACPIP